MNWLSPTVLKCKSFRAASSPAQFRVAFDMLVFYQCGDVKTSILVGVYLTFKYRSSIFKYDVFMLCRGSCSGRVHIMS